MTFIAIEGYAPVIVHGIYIVCWEASAPFFSLSFTIIQIFAVTQSDAEMVKLSTMISNQDLGLIS